MGPVRCPGAAVALGMPFKAVSSAAPAPEGPLELFDELPRMPGSVPELWRQQGEILTDYKLKLREPARCGGGASDRHRQDRGRSVDRRLAPAQVPAPSALRLPDPAAGQPGSGCGEAGGDARGNAARFPHEVVAVDESRYDGAEALGITTYSAIFNAAPKIGDPGTIVFDDAHAAEQYVAEAWQRLGRPLSARGSSRPRCSRHSVRGSVDVYQSLEQPSADVRARFDVRLVAPLRRPKMAEAINQALALLPEGKSAWWSWNLVRTGLASCLVYAPGVKS